MKRETPRKGGSAIGVALCKSSLTISSSRTSLADRDQILAASSLTVGLATEEEGRHTQRKQVDKDGAEDICISW